MFKTLTIASWPTNLVGTPDEIYFMALCEYESGNAAIGRTKNPATKNRMKGLLESRSVGWWKPDKFTPQIENLCNSVFEIE